MRWCLIAPMRTFRFGLIFAATFAANIAFGAPQASFDCPRASSALERAICADEEIARLDRHVHFRIREWIARLGGAARDEAEAGHKSWLDVRTLQCDPGGADAAACLLDLYRRRLAEVEAVLRVDVALRCEVDETRASLVFGPKLAERGVSILASGSREECTLKGGVHLRAWWSGVPPGYDTSPGHGARLKLWVNRRLAYDSAAHPGVDGRGRIEVAGGVVSLCLPSLTTDRVGADGMRCVPTGTVENAGRLDYAEFPPDPALPSADAPVVAYAAEKGFCDGFVREGRIALPNGVDAIPWALADREIFFDGRQVTAEEFTFWTTRSVAIPQKFRIGGVDHALMPGRPGYAEVRQSGKAGEPAIICRIMPAGGRL